jgi:hypothetical protein
MTTNVSTKEISLFVFVACYTAISLKKLEYQISKIVDIEKSITIGAILTVTPIQDP